MFLIKCAASYEEPQHGQLSSCIDDETPRVAPMSENSNPHFCFSYLG